MSPPEQIRPGDVEILIVEDSPTQAEQLRLLLTGHGFVVAVAANGRQALAAALARPPTLVITDIVMPEMDGYALCAALKADAALKDIPVVMVTSLAGIQDIAKSLECGADNFIRKPYEAKTLLSRIEYILLNLELRKTSRVRMGMEIYMGGKKHFIASGREQIVDLLISTYEEAVHMNEELQQQQLEIAQSNRTLWMLYRIAADLNEVSTEAEVCEQALHGILELSGFRAGWVLLDDGVGGLRLAAASKLPGVLLAPTAMEGDCRCLRLLQAGELRRGAIIVECERLRKHGHEAVDMRSHISVPLSVGKQSLGIMNIVGADSGAVGADELRMLEAIGNQVAVAIQRVRLYHQQEALAEERGATLDALHNMEEELRAIVENLLDCVITIDTRGIVRSANPAVERILGYTADEVIGNNVSMLMPEPHRGVHDGYLDNYRRTGVARIIGIGREVEGLHKNGERIALDLAVSEYRVKGQTFFTGTLRDIRDRKRFIADLTQARADAEEANRAKANFLAAMSHEIRTPMNGVIGMIDVLHQSSLKGYQVEMVDLIRESAFSLLSIIDDILDFSKIEAGRLEIESAPTPLAAVVEQVCAMFDQAAARKGVELTLFTDPALPAEVSGDALRLRQVLINFVSNAIKFSSGQQRPGRVSVRALLAEQVADRVAVEFQVTDNGIGMEQETLSELFSPFVQADVSTTRRFGGTGLGLSISRNLAQLMGGEIAVRSVLGMGSTFTLRQPLVPLPAKSDAGAAASEVAGLSCIVVGGPASLAGDLAAYLTYGGAVVEQVADLAAAREWAATCPPGLWVWIVDAAGDEPPSPDGLRAAARSGRASGSLDVRFVVIGRGRRRYPRRQDADRVAVDGNVLTRTMLLRAAAIAAGRAGEEEQTPQPGRKEAEFSPLSRAEALRQGRLILVAEDNETNRNVILRQFALLRYAADVVDNGRQALQRWRSGDYALLLTDLHMPEMDGYQLTAAIRDEENDSRRIPIVALTANALRREAEHCRAAGMDDYLSKPVQLADLKAMIEKWLPAAQSSPDSPDPPATQAAAGPVDVSVLEGLVGSDPDIVREFLQDFRVSAAKIAAELRAACRTGEAAAVGAAAHKLKSSARSVGALALGELCAGLEEAGKAGLIDALTALLYCLETELAAVEDYLDSLPDNGTTRGAQAKPPGRDQ